MLVRFLGRLIYSLVYLEWENRFLFQILTFLSVSWIVRVALDLLRQRKLPPGPWGIPIFGYLPFLRGNAHLGLSQLADRYGPIYRLFLGNKLVVILTDHKIIREAFRLETFSGRPLTEFTQILGGYGIVNTEGELWKEQRRFVHDKLRNFGARNSQNRDDLEKRIMNEVRLLLKVMAEKKGNAYNMHRLLASSLSNVICSMLMSVRFDHRDAKFQRFLHLMDEGLKLFTLSAPVNFVSGLRYVPGINWAYQKIVKNRDEMFVFFREIIEQHKCTLDQNNVRDFLDAYLIEIQRQNDGENNNGKDGDRKKSSYFSENQLCQIIGDLFSAGLEPVKDTLQWALLYMITHPEIQRKVQEELSAIIGDDRLPCLHDLPYLPYTEATIMEVQRMANVLAIGTSRSTTKTTELCGYTIPKDAHILPLLWAVHMDPSHWKDPETFNPSRFLDEAGRTSKPDYFIPFSTGRRMCIGDVLAKMEIFLFFASILHQFDLAIPDGEPAPSLEGITAITRTPSQFRVAATLRRDSLCTKDYYGNS